MKNENYNEEISIKCGKVTDGFETLQEICKEEAEKLVATINVPDNAVVSEGTEKVTTFQFVLCRD